MTRGSAWSIFLAGAALASCMGSGRTDEASAAISYVDFVAEAKRSLCELQAKCSKNQPDVATCMAWNLGRLSLEGKPDGVDIECAADDVAAARVDLDPDEAQRCLTAIQTMPCGSPHYDYFALEHTTQAACSRVFAGRVPVGGECRWLHRDCARGLECVGCTGTDCKGTCQVEPSSPPPAHIGESCFVCNGSHCTSSCIDGWCDDLNGWVCEPKLPDGSQCPGGREASCEGGGCWNMMMGCFTAPKQVGAACVVPGVTGCMGPLACESRTMTCVPYRALGEACAGADVPCAGRGSCVNGQCQFVPNGGVLGASCVWTATPPPDVQYGNSCDAALDCDMGLCVARKPQCF